MKNHFPKFARFLENESADIGTVLPPLLPQQISNLKQEIGLPLPAFYKTFLGICGGFRSGDDTINVNPDTLFVMRFPAHAKNQTQKWPPPADGMLCFTDYQQGCDESHARFDADGGLVGGEYPVFNYNHRAGTMRKLTDSFGQWLETLEPDNSDGDD